MSEHAHLLGSKRCTHLECPITSSAASVWLTITRFPYNHNGTGPNKIMYQLTSRKYARLQDSIRPFPLMILY